MTLLRGAWTTNVIWQLSGGPRRFGELCRDIPGISPKVLTARLRELEKKRVVLREVLPSSPPSVEYALSELGKELIPVIDAIRLHELRRNQLHRVPTLHELARPEMGAAACLHANEAWCQTEHDHLS
ncbi:MAG: transcriptional regulator [Gammaproteobacteria bacterium]|nr:transcriptional regulator [Gammaproteobacteria bacterium]